MSPDCKEWDSENGDCTSCYDGYTLINGKCSIPERDPNCHNWNEAGHYCVECSDRYYQSSSTNRCEQVSDQCEAWDSSNGHCTDCYDGYELNEGKCELPSSSGDEGQVEGPGNSTDLDPNCHNYDADGNCTQCAWRYYFDEDGICQKVSDDCKNWDTANGRCTECYQGYTLEDGKCMI